MINLLIRVVSYLNKLIKGGTDMFEKKKSSPVNSLISTNTFIEGSLTSEGVIRIDGRVHGNVSIKGDLFLGQTARVEGNIEANNLYIDGSVEGNVKATGYLRLSSGARLFGDIEVLSFIADEGAVFQGKCIMFENEKEKQAETV